MLELHDVGMLQLLAQAPRSALSASGVNGGATFMICNSRFLYRLSWKTWARRHVQDCPSDIKRSKMESWSGNFLLLHLTPGTRQHCAVHLSWVPFWWPPWNMIKHVPMVPGRSQDISNPSSWQFQLRWRDTQLSPLSSQRTHLFPQRLPENHRDQQKLKTGK